MTPEFTLLLRVIHFSHFFFGFFLLKLRFMLTLQNLWILKVKGHMVIKERSKEGKMSGVKCALLPQDGNPLLQGKMDDWTK